MSPVQSQAQSRPGSIQSYKLNVARSGVVVIATECPQAEVPTELAGLTRTVLSLHQANGDLDWVRAILEAQS